MLIKFACSFFIVTSIYILICKIRIDGINSRADCINLGNFTLSFVLFHLFNIRFQWVHNEHDATCHFMSLKADFEFAYLWKYFEISHANPLCLNNPLGFFGTSEQVTSDSLIALLQQRAVKNV